VVLVATVGSPAQAREQTRVANNCRHAIVRPGHILFACGDGGFYVRRLRWSTWHPFFAMGRGVFHQNACHPSCAEGTFHTETGTIRLRHRRWCAEAHVYVYRRAAIVYDGELIGRHRVAFQLACPTHR